MSNGRRHEAVMKCENFYKNYVQEGFLVEMKKLSPAAELISSFPRESVF